MKEKGNQNFNARIDFPVTQDQKNLMKTQTMMSGCSSMKEYILQKTIYNTQEKEFLKGMDLMSQDLVEIQKQLFMLYKLNVTILLELTKAPQFIQKISQENKDLIQRTIDIYKDQADKTFKSTKGEEKIL